MLFRSRFPAALAFLVTLLLAGSASAQKRIVVLPPGPTSVTPVTVKLYIVCQVQSHTVERAGNTIKIRVVVPSSEMCDPPIPIEFAVPIGTLAPGEYRVEVTGDPLEVLYSESFIVRNGSPTALEVHPFVIPTVEMQRTQVRLHRNGQSLCGATCEGVSIRVDGVLVPASDMEPAGDGALWFYPPSHAEGLANIVVTTPQGTYDLPGSLYYFDQVGLPETSVFERILFPILTHSGGAHGSEWVSEATIANPKPWSIVNYNYVEPFVCLLIQYPCFERRNPGEVASFSGDGFPQGALLLSPRAEAPNLAFSLRVRDVARQSEGFGTEIPVVREQDMFTNTELTLLDVPIDPRYRVKVRAYVLDSGPHTALVTVVRDPSTSEAVRVYDVPVTHDCSPGIDCALTPAYAEFDVPAGNADERAQIYVQIGGSETPAWAFASVTNNDTQQVTIVTADGAGGRP